jgi:hypothetical protein
MGITGALVVRRIDQLHNRLFCNLTNFGMLFNAVVMNCNISNFLQILSVVQLEWTFQCAELHLLTNISVPFQRLKMQ